MSELKDKLVLVVDDETRMINFMRMNLELEGCRVLSATNGRDAIDQVREELPDIILLDIMMPGMDGFETLRRLREFSQAPVLILTAKDDEEDRIKGLELGADDYVGKPFSHRELVSRIRAVLRRHYAAPPTPQTSVQVDQRLTIDFARREVLVNGERINLRPTEYRLLYHLVQNAGYVMTHEMLLSRVWGPEYRDETHYLRLYVTYLRQKIEEDPADPQYILTERGTGYRFVDFNRK
ncbi:MAG: response regulator transcription factor [Chloroflexi bacterium AL-W]|nr:response regulator transcription factor [Chloroflexi bacterium AL-N1]NOK69954.1 response regulator transcription factor [Chloroflexi bacterium AL-N10]NOK73749.1 response regulator transcription factor [Chloroflexi bacterium AL-N5]NOK85486.1 response regulator transcription factor [Chloroflexi bacterium AL-W]NOK91687.1 response regulator transcription factor [Chloroflexi bacterium AL-N15]